MKKFRVCIASVHIYLNSREYEHVIIYANDVESAELKAKKIVKDLNGTNNDRLFGVYLIKEEIER